MRNKVLYALIGILLLTTILAASLNVARAQTQTPAVTAPEPPRTITVNGSGKTYLTPDIAYINIGVHTEGKNASDAVAANNAQSQKLVDALKAAGVDAKDIQTTNFSIWPNQTYDQQGQPTGTINYIVDNQVFLTVRKLEGLGDLLDVAIESGANSINGIQFDVEDKTSALSDARAAAVADAAKIAEELAGAASLSLGRIVSISENVGNSPIPYFDGRGGGAAELAASVPISPGQMLVSVNVIVAYDIE